MAPFVPHTTLIAVVVINRVDFPVTLGAELTGSLVTCEICEHVTHVGHCIAAFVF